MSESITIRKPADIATVVPILMGFTPSESLVIAGFDGAPTARVDLGPVESMAEGLAPALHYWRGAQVIVAVYTADTEAANRVAAALDVILPGVTPIDIVLVDVAAGVVIGGDNVEHPFGEVELPPSAVAKRVLGSRADLIAEAATETDADTCEKVAWAAFDTGNGAKAWVWHDQAVALRGSSSPSMTMLNEVLTEAVKPG